MKQILFTTLLICYFIPFSSFAQTDSLKVKTSDIENTEQKHIDIDSITIAQIRTIHDRIENLVPIYKIYKTENLYNLIKLNTATGQLWLVQYGVGDTESMTTVINDNSLLWPSEPKIAGRFELYPTNNMYQFILIDTQTGLTWQVQWHTDSSKRFRRLIY